MNKVLGGLKLVGLSLILVAAVSVACSSCTGNDSAANRDSGNCGPDD